MPPPFLLHAAAKSSVAEINLRIIPRVSPRARCRAVTWLTRRAIQLARTAMRPYGWLRSPTVATQNNSMKIQRLLAA
jgi:hypothetical protein